VRDLRKRLDAGQDVSVDMLIGAELVAETAERVPRNGVARLKNVAEQLRGDVAHAADIAR